MASIRQFINKKEVKTSEKLHATFGHVSTGLENNISIIPQYNVPDKARDLYHRYAAIQKQHGEWVIPYQRGKRMRGCFKKLSKILLELEALGFDIDVTDFILAHRDVYGEDLKPHHLISKYSFSLYESYQQSKRAQEVKLSENELDTYRENTVARLAAIRGESPEQVEELLKSYDLF